MICLSLVHHNYCCLFQILEVLCLDARSSLILMIAHLLDVTDRIWIYDRICNADYWNISSIVGCVINLISGLQASRFQINVLANFARYSSRYMMLFSKGLMDKNLFLY